MCSVIRSVARSAFVRSLGRLFVVFPIYIYIIYI